MPHPIPDIHTLDTTRPDATLTFATNLITAASAHGLFLAHTPPHPPQPACATQQPPSSTPSSTSSTPSPQAKHSP